jgi:four helix bundle protein
MISRTRCLKSSSQFPVLSSQKTDHFACSLVTAPERKKAHDAAGDIMGQSYRELIAWQKAMKLVTAIYLATGPFPTSEMYGLTSQLRRAAVSVPSNIAEGQARYSQKEFHHFLSQARGSLVEIETQLLIARELDYLPAYKTGQSLAQADELGRILNGLAASIKTRIA